MAFHSTVFGQLLRLVPRHEFCRMAKQHHRGSPLRAISRWDQLVAMITAQLTGRSSLRDLVANLAVQGSKLYHLGARAVSRSTLARVNQEQPAQLYEKLFHTLLAKTQRVVNPGHPFRFEGQLVSLDVTFIRMTLSVFPWAKYTSKKGGIKLHVGLDHDGYLPVFLKMSDGKGYDLGYAKQLDLPPGSVLVFDRGYIGYDFLKHLNRKKISFVTRLRKDLKYKTLQRLPVTKGTGVTSDWIVRMQGNSGLILRLVGYRDPETGEHYRYMTNNTELAAHTIADIYRERWKIELFFRWIKQNLKIKAFLGTTPNAVLTQIWIALCVYLLLAYLAQMSKAGWQEPTKQQILRLLHLNLFARRSFEDLIRPRPPTPVTNLAQLSLPIS